MRAGVLVLLALPLAAQTRLAEFEALALANHPSIPQAEAGVRAAAGRVRQTGLYPNPVIGANGEHNTPVLNGGSIGVFGEQRIVMGGKLGISKKAAAQEELVQKQYASAAKLQLLTEVRTLFYRALGEQRLLAVRKEMAELAERTARTMAELNNVGQADKPDLFAAEVDAQRAALAVTMAQNALDRTWRELASIVNQPSLRATSLEGELETLPKVDPESALARILRESPEMAVAEARVAEFGFVVKRAKVEKIPDLQLRGGIRYNNEPVDKLSGVRRAVGNEGIFDVGIEVPLFNRNQGAVAAAEADADRARLEVDRQRLELRQRFAAVYREYSDATSGIARYRDEMLPRARSAFDMYSANFQSMAVAYPQVLAAQRTLIQLQEDYIAQLIAAWRASIEIDGLLARR